jgi:hypothetical protein
VDVFAEADPQLLPEESVAPEPTYNDDALDMTAASG